MVRVAIACALVLSTAGCSSGTPEVIGSGGANNVVAGAQFAYASLGADGLAVVDPEDGRVVRLVPPPGDAVQVDDVDVDGQLLFALDANRGRLAVFDLTTPDDPTLVDGPVNVDVGPFAGISGGGGVVVVSGGVGNLTRHRYDAAGSLSDRDGTELGVGQPDVLVSDDGSVAYVSTDFRGEVDGAAFGISALDTATLADPLRLGLTGAGFTGGLGRPANFPIESALEGQTLVVAFGGGLAVIAASSSELRLEAVVDVGFEAVNVDVAGGRAFVVGAGPRLAVVDIDSRAVTAEIDLQAGSATPTGVAVLGDRVVVAAGDAGVLAFPAP